ncbi:MAG: Glutathione S-transferase, partial [uncultured Ramlibacter sp.]
AQALHRQQELLVLVDAAVGRAAPGRHPVRGGEAALRLVRGGLELQGIGGAGQPGRL